MMVLVIARDGSRQYLVTGVERIEETDDLEVVLVTEHSEPIVLNTDDQRIDVVGLG